MESLNGTTWDVLLSGTGLPQSLLALALSRSGKKVLHIDYNDYYGGAEAAFSLQEAETWVEQVNTASQASEFGQASIRKASSDEEVSRSRLGFSRAYSISLAPHLIYTRSNLIPALVSSKVYRQLEFLAVGSWWIYTKEEGTQSEASNAEKTRAIEEQRGTLRKIPGGREDVFTDKSIDLRSTRSLMKFLKLAADAEAYPTVIPEWGERPFHEYLESRFKISPSLQAPLHALTLSPDPSNQTTVAYALPRVHQHLTSIGLFGPGFGAVLPKWGGLAEISQVACRAGAVGGGVYVLKKGIEVVEEPSHGSSSTEGAEPLPSTVILQGGDVIKTRWIIGTPSALPEDATHDTQQQSDTVGITHLTAVVSSPLTALFPPPAEGSPPPAGVVVVNAQKDSLTEGKGIIYTSTTLAQSAALILLRSAIDTLLSSVNEQPTPTILWSLSYTHHHHHPTPPSSLISNDASVTSHARSSQQSSVLFLRDLAPSMALEDEVLRDVRAVWELVTADDGDERGGFMQFEDREGGVGEEGEE
ncbi:MAG: hypothetical protein LQ344_003198 [Seirophora lacunosa]|nr:MAG: hypothetical protein LQ344_003198 [Seirophora lacunosa]